MSNIYFKNIKIRNFMSYEMAEVNLNTPGYILVSGENQNPDDSASSNGCGKSTLFNAISWALTGQTTSGIKEVANIYTSGVTEATVEFSCLGKEYVISRTKNPSNLKIFIDGEDKSGKGIRDSEKLLKEYLPEMTNSLINSVIILGQGLPQRFTNNTPAGRKEVLENLSKSDFMIEDIKQRLSDRREELNKMLSENKDIHTRNGGQCDTINKHLLDLEVKKNNLPSRETIEKEIQELSEIITASEDAKSVIELNIEDCERFIDEDTKRLFMSQQDKQEEMNNLELKDVGELATKIHKLEWDIDTKREELEKLNSVTDVCPTCGQKLPDVHKIDTSDLEQEIEQSGAELHSYKQKLEEYELYNHSLIKELDDKYDFKQRELSVAIKESKDKLSQYNEQLRKCVSSYDDYKIKLAEKQTQLSMLEDTARSLEEEINQCLNQLETISDENIVIESKIDDINNRVDINSKMSTIVKRDFRGYLLTNVIEFINSKCKRYATDVFGTTNLNFALDGNNISISYDGKEYESLSGGERQKVDVILQLSIRDMLCAYLNFSSNILVLDEITDSLDIVGAQKIFNLISNNLNDVETIFIISHHSDFEIPSDGEIRIVKGDDKISRIT